MTYRNFLLSSTSAVPSRHASMSNVPNPGDCALVEPTVGNTVVTGVGESLSEIRSRVVMFDSAADEGATVTVTVT